MLWWTLRQMNSEDPATRLAALEKLEGTNDPRVVDALEKAVADPSDPIKLAAVAALGKRGETRILFEAFAEQQPAIVRVAATPFLGKLGGVKAVRPLVDAIVGGDPVVRKAAREALEKFDPDWPKSPHIEPVIPAFVQTATRSPDLELRAAAVEILKRVGDAAVRPLVLKLLDNDYDVQMAAHEALEAIAPDLPNAAGAKSSIPTLVAALTTRGEGLESREAVLEAKNRAAYVLARVGAVDALSSNINSIDRDTRHAATTGLVALGAVEYLIPLLKHHDDEVCRLAQDGLTELGWQPAG